MMAKPIRALELRYLMIQFLIIFHLYHWMKEKYEMNTKYLRAPTIYLTIWNLSYPKLYWEKLSVQSETYYDDS